jgi:glycosyltransferase involved in cell wall biosynthesis
MNIIAIAGSTIPSDTANSIQVMKACSALAQIGHTVTLLVPNNPESKTTDLKSHYGLQAEFRIEWLSSSSRRKFTWDSVRRARALKADVIYSWFPQSAVFALLHRIPTVFEIHIQPTGFFGPMWHRAFAKLRGRKRLVSITQALVDILEQDFQLMFDSGDVVITPNGVDLERFTSLPDPITARRHTGLREAPTVMCTGHLYAGRGAELFLALARTIPTAHFVWVGGRPEDIEFWRRRVETNSIYNVTFVGFIPNGSLPTYQAAADILLMPYSQVIMGSSGTADSAAVASPMKMFEYMATGRAIASAYLPVIREVLNENNAVFCKPDDINSWKSTLERLLNDENLRTKLGRQAQQDAQGYTWVARAQRIMKGFP